MKFKEAKKKVNNALTEDGQELRDVLLELIDEVERSEQEFNAEGLAEEVEKRIREKLNREVDERVAQEVANAVAKKVTAIKDMMTPQTDKLTVKVKNEISGAILRSTNKEAVRNNVEAVLTKNAITGLTFEDVIDYAIVENWGDLDPLFAQFKKVPFTKFFYNTDALTETLIQAHQWDSVNEEDVEKTIQSLEVNGKQIVTDYIYKIQEVSFKDLDAAEKAGRSSILLTWINEELDRQIINTIMLHILVGGTATDITTFESIGGKTVTDAFTTVSTITTTDGTLEGAMPLLADEIIKVHRNTADRLVAVMSPQNLLALQKFVYASGGMEEIRSRDYVAASLGVDEIHTYSWMGDKVVAYVPNEYWVNEENALAVAYPVYMKNKQNFQKERNIGGGIHGLLSSLVVNVEQG